jgi:hypothetical protein
MDAADGDSMSTSRDPAAVRAAVARSFFFLNFKAFVDSLYCVIEMILVA